MGLDCVAMGRARPEHQEEWTRLMETYYRVGADCVEESDRERLMAISTPTYETLGAPRVGQDPEANAWALQRFKRKPEQSEAEFIAKLAGYYVVALVECDGVPRYSAGSLNREIDETSLRGDMLKFCDRILSHEEIYVAWTSVMRPEKAMEYGDTLLAAAGRARRGELLPEPPPPPPPPTPKPTWLQRLFGVKPAAQAQPIVHLDTLSIDEQIDVVEVAGRWYRFWGSRGHPIWAWF